MRRVIVLCMLVAFIQPALATLYKCKDADGNTVYTDEPCADGKQLTLPPLPTYSPPKLPAASTGTDGKKNKEPKGYTSLVINKPEDDSIIRDNTGSVEIGYTLTPPLESARGHRFVVVIDGKQLKTKGTTSQLKLSEIDRGTHTIQINVVDDEDKILITSKPTSFHMKQHSILHPKPRSGRKTN